MFDVKSEVQTHRLPLTFFPADDVKKADDDAATNVCVCCVCVSVCLLPRAAVYKENRRRFVGAIYASLTLAGCPTEMYTLITLKSNLRCCIGFR